MRFCHFFTKKTLPTDQPTDERTDRRTDTPSYWDGRTHLKKKLHFLKKKKERIYIYKTVFFPHFIRRPHSSLDFFTPYEVHYDSHVSSHIARYNSGQHNERQKETFSFFSSRTDSRLRVGDRVLLRSKKRYFEKLSPIFYPRFVDKTFTIEAVDKRFMPWTFKLAEISDDKRRFYSFELRKLDSSYQSQSASSPLSVNDRPKILVKDITVKDKTKLRSGTSIPGKGRVFYIIQRAGKTDEISEAALRTLKNALGQDAIEYDATFQQPPKSNFVL